MKSWEVLRDAIEPVGVKAIAAEMNLSSALVYKWCQEPGEDSGAASGARNPLDRIRTIIELTRDPRIANWVCNAAGGFFVPNPEVKPTALEEQLLATTQRLVQNFGQLLADISRSVENDGQIIPQEAESIRQSWEQLKSAAEGFVVAAERAMYERKPGAKRSGS